MNICFRTYGFVALLLSLSLVVSGCSRKLYQEGTLIENRVQVEETSFSEKIPAYEFDRVYAQNLGQYYRTYGAGRVDFSVLYDPQSKINSAIKASQEVKRITNLMEEYGVYDYEANILPVKNLGDRAELIITFDSYEAQAPAGCDTMPGFSDTDLGRDDAYKMGCTVETLFARQVARPRDLLGNDDAGETTDGRRASNIGELYRSGVPNKPLDGQSASGN